MNTATTIINSHSSSKNPPRRHRPTSASKRKATQLHCRTATRWKKTLEWLWITRGHSKCTFQHHTATSDRTCKRKPLIAATQHSQEVKAEESLTRDASTSQQVTLRPLTASYILLRTSQAVNAHNATTTRLCATPHHPRHQHILLLQLLQCSNNLTPPPRPPQYHSDKHNHGPVSPCDTHTSSTPHATLHTHHRSHTIQLHYHRRDMHGTWTMTATRHSNNAPRDFAALQGPHPPDHTINTLTQT